MRVRLGWAGLLTVAALAAFGERATAQATGAAARDTTPLALTHVTVIDGTGAPPSPEQTVLVRAGRIVSVFATDGGGLPAGARVEDLSGRFLIPGLIDAHVHLSGAADDFAGYARLLRWALGGGLTSVRDMAGDDRILTYLAREARLDEIPAPDIYYAALMAGPTFFDVDPRAAAASAGAIVGRTASGRAVDAGTDIRLAVAAARGAGATGVKLYADLPDALVETLTAEAHRQGLMVWAHATVFPAGPMDVVRAGADAISHSAYLVWAAAPRVPRDYRIRAHGDFRHVAPDDPRVLAVLDTMRARGTILDATLCVFDRSERRAPDHVAPGIAAWGAAVTRLAHERGVLVDAGTDDVGDPESDTLPNLHGEMAYLVQHAGFTPIEAIEAATRTAALAIGIESTHGTITPGKVADLVVLSADPSRDIAATRRIVEVFKGGRVYEP